MVPYPLREWSDILSICGRYFLGAEAISPVLAHVQGQRGPGHERQCDQPCKPGLDISIDKANLVISVVAHGGPPRGEGPGRVEGRRRAPRASG
ncbi:hypothetical protein EVAR_78802_1 [Eumeta japonica]|uniref:Uncharacterized protein n=1 Tax=Eumeta variegata TaxID=151549 RepID=A0A4C1T440_EUMVA|nr:hypothetical protein EVAR_78802_1 [Eumeta japonica]